MPNLKGIVAHAPLEKGQAVQAELKSLAAFPTVVCKLSGLTTEADWKNWQPADLKDYFQLVLKFFGFNRVLFGGDWPVATLATNCGRR